MSKIEDILEKIEELEVKRMNYQLKINEELEYQSDLYYNPYNGNIYNPNLSLIPSWEDEQRIIDVDITRLKIDYLFEEKVNEMKSIKNRINV